jgi:hypothetical protein
MIIRAGLLQISHTYHPKAFADFAAAESGACFGSLVLFYLINDSLMCLAIWGYSGILGLLNPVRIIEIISQ